jgi:hypothetical protein
VNSSVTNRFKRILGTLAAHNVNFILVGGVAAIFNGAPIATFDVDIVHDRDLGNIARLLSALSELGAVYRQPGRELRPDTSHLAGLGRQLLTTKFGLLDVLGAIGDGHDYADLLPHTTEVDIGEKAAIRVLNIEMLIQSKHEVSGEKDKAVLDILRRTLIEKSQL